MKTISKICIILAFFAMPGVVNASMSQLCDLGDTIPAVPRCDKYYYTKWIDDCPNWCPNGVWDSCFCFKYHMTSYVGGSTNVAKWEYAHNRRMKVKGLVAMVKYYNSPTVDTAAVVQKVPEYLYLYQMTSAGHFVFQEMEDIVQLEVIDSVRWDTATARVMEFRQGWNDEYVQYCYLYEAYFDHPVWVDTDFYIVGTHNSDYAGGGMIPTQYLDIMDQQDYMLREKNCDINNYRFLIGSDGPLFQDGYNCQLPGRPYAFQDWFFPEIGWISDWPYSPVGYYLPIVDWRNLNAEPNDVGFGEVLGSGRFPDESDDTITAIPAPGYAFVSWNDGVTDNPRVVHLMSDTSFVAIFQCSQQFNLQVSAADDSQGSVTGGGSYCGSDVTITAMPALGHRFVQWNDGVTSNPRTLHLVSDTVFVAYFEDISNQTFDLQVSSADETMGTVTGGGTYAGGTNNTITAVPAEMRFRFTQWNDGVTDNPRVVYLTGDTAFVAYFVEMPVYNLRTATNNDEWGFVEGEGLYAEGDVATLTITPAVFCTFDGWEDGNQQSPRTVTVTQDTLFTALFSYDSTQAAIDLVGDLVFTIAPNPTSGHLSIMTGQPGTYELTIYDMTGKTLSKTKHEEPVFETDISALPAGQYLFMIRNNDKYGIRTIVKK